MDSHNPRKRRKPKLRGSRKQQLHKKRIERVKEQIEFLSDLVVNTIDIELKRNYVLHIRLLAQKVQFPIPSHIKQQFCRRCSEVFTLEPVPTFRVRLRSKNHSNLVYSCLKCGYIRRKFLK